MAFTGKEKRIGGRKIAVLRAALKDDAFAALDTASTNRGGVNFHRQLQKPYLLLPPGWSDMDWLEAAPFPPPPPPMRSLVFDLLLLTVVARATGSCEVDGPFFSTAKPAVAVTSMSKPPHSNGPIKRIVMMLAPWDR
jgi:hypothetical protein